MIISRPVLLRMRNVSYKFVEKIEAQILCPITFFSLENLVVYEMMWKNIVEWDRRMWTACWTPKVTNTHSEYVILFPFHAPPCYVIVHCLSCFRLRYQPNRFSSGNILCPLCGATDSCIKCRLIIVHSLTIPYCLLHFPKHCSLSIWRNQYSLFEQKL